MKKSYLLIATALFSLASCGGSPAESKSADDTFKISAAAPKEHSSLDFAWSYTINETTTSIRSFSLKTTETGVYAEFKTSWPLSVIISADKGYELESGATCSVDGTALTLKEVTSLGMKYYIWDVPTTPKKDVVCSLNYTVKEALANITVGDFAAPTSDPNNNYSALYFSGSLNGDEIKYQQSNEIKAADLKAALDALANNHVLKVSGTSGLSLKAFFKDGRFFADRLNFKEMGISGTYKANYKEYYTIFNFIPASDGTIAFDFSSLKDKNFKDYSIASKLGTTEIGAPTVLVDGQTRSEALTKAAIDGATSVVLKYPKSLFDGVSADYTRVDYVKISDSNFFPETGRTVVDQTNECVNVILKDSGSSLAAVHPFQSYLDGAVEGLNTIPKDSSILLNYEIKFINK